MLENRFGQFRDGGQAFAITDFRTPAPWCNVICNGRYGLVVSQTGSGFSWLDDSQQNVLTRWEMDLTRDARGRALYVSDLDDGSTWSLSPAPCFAPIDGYECVHEPGVTTFRGSRADVAWTWTIAVAPQEPVEVWRVELENRSGRMRRLRIASMLEWCLGVAPDSKREFHRLFLETSHDARRGAVVARKHMWDIPSKREHERWNRPWPHVAAHGMRSHDMAMEARIAIGSVAQFIGRYGDARRPAGMDGSAERVGGFGRGEDACAAVGGDVVISPGKSARIDFVLGIEDDDGAMVRLLDRSLKASFVDGAIDGARSTWEDLLAATHIECDRPDVEALCNTWLPYQAISGRLWGRTGYYQQSGAFGFRDQLQDSQVWLPIDPEACRAHVVRAAGQQYVDGSVNHWWHPLSGQSNRTTCSDDYLWLAFVACAHARETGSLSIFEATAPFVDESGEATILEHCRRSIERAWSRRSARGLPLLGACDWNDGLSSAGLEERGESVWLAFFLAEVLERMGDVFERVGDEEERARCASRRASVLGAANEHGWDGSWFRRATTDDGTWIGASSCEFGRIYLNPQTWAVLVDGASADRLQAAWASVKTHLLAEMGPLLLAPAYATPDASIGYITRYAPGARENGGVYMHAATWALAAACKMRDVEAVGEIWDAISPAWRARQPDRYCAEAYVTPGNVDGPDSATPGRAGWTWYTGSAAWMQRVVHERVLGVQPEFEGLRIDPCPARSLGLVRWRRRWRGRTIRFEFDAAEYRPELRPVVVLDGTVLESNLIPEELVHTRAPGSSVTVRWEAPTVQTRRMDAALTREEQP